MKNVKGIRLDAFLMVEIRGLEPLLKFYHKYL